MSCHVDRINSSLRLGITVEGDSEDNPLAPIVNTFSEEQISWISSWLAGDGYGLIPESWKRPADFEELAMDRATEVIAANRDGSMPLSHEEMFLSGALWAALMAEGRL